MRLRYRLAFFVVPAGLLALIVDAPVSRSADQPVPTPQVKGADAAHPSAYQKDALPFLKRHCFACHGDGKARADLSFDKYTDDASLVADRKVWDNVLHMLKAREMPPKERPRPAPAEVEAATAAIQGIFD